MAEWVNVFEKAVLDTKAEGLNDELKSMGWHFFEKSNLTEFAAIRGALIKLFPDTIISQEKTLSSRSKGESCVGPETK